MNSGAWRVACGLLSRTDMSTARRFEDLLVWQRMHELNTEVWKVTDRPTVSRHFKFCDQIRDASDSAERNVAEGFGRFNPGQFAYFLDIARASALETKTLLAKGLDVGYWEQEEFDRLDGLATRGIQAVAKLQRYLRSPQAKRNPNAATAAPGLRRARTPRTT